MRVHQWRASSVVCRVVIAVLGASGLTDAAQGQTVLRVRAGAAPGGNGQTWAMAYDTLNAALSAAQAVPQPQTVELWIAGGTYKPTAGLDRLAVFQLQRSNTALLGGFAGTESLAGQRNPAVNVTTLSGDLGVVGSEADNSFRVLVVIGASGVTLDGLTVERGNADSATSNFGAGLHVSSGLVTFRRMTFQQHRAIGNGAGVSLIALAGETLFEDCRFIGNAALGQGGAMFINADPASTVRFRGCRFEGNSGGTGGAITSVRAGGLVFEPSVASGSTRFIQNSAVSNGGAIQRGVNSRHSITASHTEFIGNTVGNPTVSASASGGALSLSSPVANPTDDVFTDCVFDDNRIVAPAASIRGGGAINAGEGALRLTRCVVTRNSSGAGSSSRGGAIFYAQGAATTTNPNPPGVVIERSVFVGNTAPESVGGAVYTFRGPLDIRHTGFHGNTAGIGGFAVYYDAPLTAAGVQVVPVTVNCAFTGNSCTQDGTPDQFGSLCTLNAAQGVYTSQGTVRMVNCTFTRNYGDLNAGLFLGWTGINVPDPVVTNCIFHGNVARPIGQTYYSDEINGTNPPLIPGGIVLGNPANAPNWVNITHCAIEGLVTSASGNTPADPSFVDPDGADGVIGTADDDASLRANSPVIDAGSNAALLAVADPRDDDSDGNTSEAVPLDLRGARRVLDIAGLPAGGSSGPVVDFGAYETTPPATAAQTFWVEPAGGLFETAGNWSPRVPGAQDQMVFDLGVSYSVNLSADRNVGSMLVRDDTVSLNLGGRRLAMGDAAQPVVIGSDGPSGPAPADAAVVNLSAGRVSSISTLLANGPGTSAAVTLDQVQWTNSGSSFCVGCLGSARLTIGAGSRVSTPFATLGQQPGSEGVIDVSGVGAEWTSSLLTVVQSGGVVVREGASANTGFSGLLLLQGGTLAGAGTVRGGVLNFGSVAPGGELPTAERGAAFSAGTLTLEDDYRQVGNLPETGQTSGSLLVELGSSANDRLVVNGTALLAGGLFVSLEPGFTPPPPTPGGEAYRATIVDAEGVGAGPGVTPANDRFDVALFPGLPGGRYFQLEYASDGPRRVVRVVQAELDGEIQTGPGANYNASGAPTDALLARLNSDVFPDLVLVTPAVGEPEVGAGAVIVLKNRRVSGGTWQGFEAPGPQALFSVGVLPVAAASADFDGDGRADLAVACRGSGDVRLLLNTTPPDPPGGSSTITFEALPAIPVGLRPGGLAALDYDSNGRADLVVTVAGAGAGGAGLLVPLRNAGGVGSGWNGLVVESGVPVGVGPTDVAAGRLEGASDPNGPDVVVVNSGDGAAPGDSVTVLFNRGSAGSALARFGGARTVPVGVGPLRVLLPLLEADKDTDDLTSIVTLNLGLATGGTATRGARNVAEAGSVSIIRGLVGGVFTPAVSFQVGFDPTSAAASDLDLDGDNDLAIVTRPTQGATDAVVRVLRNDTQPAGPGGPANLAFAPLNEDLASGGGGSLVESADIDGDTDADLVVVNTQSFVMAGAGAGPGAALGGPAEASVTVLPSLLRAPPSACVGDFNNDRSVDTRDLTYFLNRFGLSFPGGNEPADLNGDGSVNTSDLTRFLGRFSLPCP